MEALAVGLVGLVIVLMVAGTIVSLLRARRRLAEPATLEGGRSHMRGERER